MRLVQVQIGAPKDAIIASAPPKLLKSIEQNQMSEAFCVLFIEEDGRNNLVALMGCLCVLEAATAAWLMGASLDELEAVLASSVREHNEDPAPGEDQV